MPKSVGGQKSAEKRGGRPSAGSKDHPGSTGDTPERIPPAVQGGRGRLPERHIEQVPDLRERYEIDQPGVYYVRFTGKEADIIETGLVDLVALTQVGNLF